MTVYKLLSFGFVFDTMNTGLLLYMADLKAKAEPLLIGSDGNNIKMEQRLVIHKVRFAKATFGCKPSGTTYNG